MKSIIALIAAFALATTAYAQSNVTVYGTVDAGFARSTADSINGVDTKTGIHGGLLEMNKLGFRGEEGLGNGMKALFQIEFGYDFGQNSGINTSRESFIGLDTGSLGLVKLGRLETLDSVAATAFDAMGASAFSAVGTAVGRETFANSAVGYSIKPVKGLELSAQYAFDGSTANANTAFGNGVDQERGYGLGAVYGTGPFAVGYVYTNTRDFGRVAGDDRRQHLVGASYDFTVVKLYGEYVDAKSDMANVLDSKIYVLGAKVPVTKMTSVDGSFARVNDDVTNGDANIYGIQLVHNLSKRTAAYAGYQYVSNNDTSFAALNTNGVVPVVAGAGSNGNSSGFGAGLKHSF